MRHFTNYQSQDLAGSTVFLYTLSHMGGTRGIIGNRKSHKITTQLINIKVINMSTSIIRDVEFHWANVHKPHAPFGANIWDIQVRTTDADTYEELKSRGVNMKTHDDGYYYGNVKRNEKNRKGEPNDPPRVVDEFKAPITDSIGNGSKGNIMIFTYDYNVSGRKGTGAMLSAIQVTDLVEYSGSVDFDAMEGF